MTKVLGIQEPFGVLTQKKFGKPWENFLLESGSLLQENGDFLLLEKGGKIILEADFLLLENGSKIYFELGRPEFILFSPHFFLLQENSFKIKIDYPYAYSSFGIYRLQNCREGKISTRRKFYNYNTAATPARIICRNKFVLAVSAWQGLTAEQKAAYNKKAIGRHLSGYNLFIKEFLLT